MSKTTENIAYIITTKVVITAMGKRKTLQLCQEHSKFNSGSAVTRSDKTK